MIEVTLPAIVEKQMAEHGRWIGNLDYMRGFM